MHGFCGYAHVFLSASMIACFIEMKLCSWHLGKVQQSENTAKASVAKLESKRPGNRKDWIITENKMMQSVLGGSG